MCECLTPCAGKNFMGEFAHAHDVMEVFLHNL